MDIQKVNDEIRELDEKVVRLQHEIVLADGARQALRWVAAEMGAAAASAEVPAAEVPDGQ